jgi:GlpG protein
MRLLGTLSDGAAAVLVQGLLSSRQIDCRVDPTLGGGGFEVWALNEDQMSEARALYQQFLADPRKEVYTEQLAAAIAGTIQAHAPALAAPRFTAPPPASESEISVVSNVAESTTPLSHFIIFVCIAIYIAQTLKPEFFLVLANALQIAPLGAGDLSAIFPGGQIWRLFTPVLMHSPMILPDGGFQFMGILHIGFNLMFMRDLAPIVERRHGTLYFLLLFLAVAGLSNLAQYYSTGPNFLGISGVVYGLLGFIWIRGKFDPHYNLHLNQGLVYFMLLWLAFSLFGSHIAGGAHLAGFAVGAGWGFLSARAAKAVK